MNTQVFNLLNLFNYLARVKDLRTYDSVSKDILHRWTYPYVPDNNIVGDTNFSFSRGMIYKEDDVKLSRTCSIFEETAIGAHTEVSSNTVIRSSTIGRNCKIGDLFTFIYLLQGSNCVIEGCYIWDNVVISDNVKIKKSIICSGANILHDTVIQQGCVISYNVFLIIFFHLTR